MDLDRHVKGLRAAHGGVNALDACVAGKCVEKPGRGWRGPRTDEQRAFQAEKMRNYWARKKAVKTIEKGVK